MGVETRALPFVCFACAPQRTSRVPTVAGMAATVQLKGSRLHNGAAETIRSRSHSLRQFSCESRSLLDGVALRGAGFPRFSPQTC